MLPIIYSGSGLTIYTYPLFIGLAWAFAFGYSYERQANKSKFIIYSILLFISSWLGAKLLFVLSTPDFFLPIITRFNFWTGGGFVFYGGLIGGVLASILFAFLWPKKINFAAIVTALCLGHAVGRVGCYLTGCCHGFKMHDGGFFPVQLLESFVLLLLFLYLHQKRKQSTSAIIMTYFFSYALLRFFLEFFRDDQIRGHIGFLSTSQWISVVIILMVPIVGIVYSRFFRKN
jgi:phosphatidylglycerol:prolipoprotein diacylglycerol transferase